MIIPLYNKVDTISRSIKSVLNQTYSNFELIIIDDGSIDGSGEIVSQFNDSRIRFYSQKNSGLPATRNRGIQLSSSELITFLDADDEWLPSFLETVLKLYSEYPSCGIYATGYKLCRNRRSHTVRSSLIHDTFTGIIPSYFKVAPHNPFCAITVLIPKHTFETVGYFNPQSRMAEDIEMWTKIAMKFPICYTAKPCALYHTDGANQMTKSYYSINNHPVINYVLSLDSNQLNMCNHINDLMIYLDYCRLSWGYFNMGAGDMKVARSFLKDIKSKQYQVSKNILHLLSLIPFGYGKYAVYLRVKIANCLSMFWTKEET